MTEQFLYLTTTGWKTGEPRQIEIWFVELEGRHYIVSEAREESKWVRNIERDPAVIVSVGTRRDRGSALAPSPAVGRVVRAASEPALVAAVAALMDRKYGWSDGLVVELRIT